MTASTTFDSTKKSLFDILSQVEDGKIQLPDFQRGWVWDDEHLRSLLASISLSYPIGTIMLLETGNVEVRFKPRAVEGVKLNEPAYPEKFILDGQQRLTSLYLALLSGAPVPTFDAKKKPLERHYYMDMVNALDQEVDREDAVIGLPATRIQLTFRGEVQLDYSTSENEYRSMVFPISQMFDSASWQRGFNKYWNYDGEKIELCDRFEAEVIDRFKQYLVPVILMEKGTPKEAVCQVFEKVNTGGVSLTVFELLTATYAADDFSLRDDWDARQQRIKRLDMNDPPPRTVLDSLQNTDFIQCVSLLATRARRLGAVQAGFEPDKAPAITCKRKDVLRLALEDYSLWVEPATYGFVAAAKLLHTQNLFTARDLPYRTQLVPLAAILAVLKHKIDQEGVRQKVLRWYWSGVFGELYGAAIESRFARDLPEVLAWIDGGPEPATVSEANFLPARLRTMRTRNSAAYKGVHALLMRHGCRDLLSTETITHQNYFEQNVDIHHIFPQHWCRQKGLDPRQFDSIINKTPLSARTNQIIGGVAPSSYLPRLEKRSDVAKARMDEHLQTHLIDSELLRGDRFDDFLKAREESLILLIEQATGKSIVREVAVDEDLEDYEADENVA